MHTVCSSCGCQRLKFPPVSSGWSTLSFQQFIDYSLKCFCPYWLQLRTSASELLLPVSWDSLYRFLSLRFLKQSVSCDLNSRRLWEKWLMFTVFSEKYGSSFSFFLMVRMGVMIFKHFIYWTRNQKSQLLILSFNKMNHFITCLLLLSRSFLCHFVFEQLDCNMTMYGSHWSYFIWNSLSFLDVQINVFH